RNEGDVIGDSEFISAAGKHVIIIGGGDTGADCLGTAHRQGARSVTQLELLPMPPETRAEDNPWPQWPHIFRVSPAHEEGGVKLTDRGNVGRDARWMTNVPGVFAAGDMQRGQSLIVWAIAEGRSAARGIDHFLMGESQLPAPLS